MPNRLYLLHLTPRDTLFLKLYSLFPCSFLSPSLVLYALLFFLYTFSLQIHLVWFAKKSLIRKITLKFHISNLSCSVHNFSRLKNILHITFTPFYLFLPAIKVSNAFSYLICPVASLPLQSLCHPYWPLSHQPPKRPLDNLPGPVL